MKIFDLKGIEIVDGKIQLGTLEVGAEKVYKYQLFNDSVGFLNNIQSFIVIKNEDGKKIKSDEFKILKSPVTLRSGEKAEIEFRWSPSLDVRENIDASIAISAEEVYRVGTKG